MAETRDAGAVAGPQGQNGARADGQPLEDMDTVIARLKAMMAAAEEGAASTPEAGQAPAAADGGSAPPVDPPEQAQVHDGAPPQPEGTKPPVRISAEVEVITHSVAAPVAQPLGAPEKGLAEPLTAPKIPLKDAQVLSDEATEPRTEPSETLLQTSGTPDHFDFG